MRDGLSGSAREGAGAIFLVFLRLGLTSFGGPVAHIGYFREALVRRRAWLSEAEYAELVALCQFLPGPASSQVGLALGLIRGGLRGALAAWAGFTLPSAIALAAFAAGLASAGDVAGAGWLAGVKAAAVAVVAQALLGMARSLAPDAPRQILAAAAGAAALLAPGLWGQLGAIALGAAAGLTLLRGAKPQPSGPGLASPLPLGTAAACLVAFFVLLAALPFAAPLCAPFAWLDAFYRSGALVFGGGHVVLPLLQAETVASGWVAPDAFTAGYGAAQAVPGPLFTFAAYLGWVAGGALGAILCLIGIFLPGALLVLGALPFWDRLRARPSARAALTGVNAAVVGLLLAALYDPVFISGAATPGAFVVVLAAYFALSRNVPPPFVVIGAAALGQGMAWAQLPL